MTINIKKNRNGELKKQMKTNQLWVIFWQLMTYTIFVLNVLGFSRIDIIVPTVTLFAGAIAGYEKERDK